MGREGQWINQPITEAVDISNWKKDDEFGIYPEGARDKTLLYSPVYPSHEFLIPNHRYLYKYAFVRHPDQFWTEIIAYQVGCLLDVPVPPAFIAFDENDDSCGALIEWFLNYPEQPEERFVPGGDIMVNLIPNFDRKKGQQHNFTTVENHLNFLATNKKVAMADWLTYWCDMLLFDALIGNTDRHQDNWGLLWQSSNEKLKGMQKWLLFVRACLLWQPLNEKLKVRMTPVFDNGTSLGYEILESKMDDFYKPDDLQKYFNRGCHHIRWQLDDKAPVQHIELLESLVSKYPLMASRIKNKLKAFDMDSLKAIIANSTKFDIRIPLTEKRAAFVCHLIESRYLAISERIEKYP
ncbi:MAG: hypothetical protein EPN17_02020 [Methylobacter sp.]|nr:MAG: hypothetical protein EPN17_02020 [Methylobacter sp.]